MADDNVRALFFDGMPLGADELNDDQTYFRAALERRSLTRDLYGVAWGLELAVVDDSPRVSPGVAYTGEGKVVVVRRPFDIAAELTGKEGKFSVYLRFTEEEKGQSELTYCDRAIDARMAESYAVEIAPFFESELVAHGPARVEPYTRLPRTPDSSGRVRLGVLKANDPDGAGPRFELIEGARRIPGVKYEALAQKRDTAEHVGVAGAVFTHPRRWKASAVDGEKDVDAALEIDPTSGVFVKDPLVVEDRLVIKGPDTSENPGAILRYAEKAVNKETEPGVVLEVSHQEAGAVKSAAVLRAGEKVLEAPQDLVVEGTSRLGEVEAGAVTAKGTLTAAADLVAEGATFGDEVTFKDKVTAEAGLEVSGDTTTIEFVATDPAVPKIALAVTGKTVLNEDPVTHEVLEVNGAVAFGAVTVGGNLGVSGVATFSTTARFNGPLIANGNSTFGGTASFNGPINLNGSVTYAQPPSFQSGASFNGAVTAKGATFGPDPVTVNGDAAFNQATRLNTVTVDNALVVGGISTFDNHVIVGAICVRVPTGAASANDFVGRALGTDGASFRFPQSGDAILGVGVGVHASGDLLLAIGGVASVDVDGSSGAIAPGTLLTFGADGKVKANASPGYREVVGRALGAPSGGSVKILVKLV